MPLSKKRDRERAKERRRLAKLSSNLIQPKIDVLQSKSSPVETLLNSIASPTVQPKCYLAHLPNCPDGRYREKENR